MEFLLKITMALQNLPLIRWNIAGVDLPVGEGVVKQSRWTWTNAATSLILVELTLCKSEIVLLLLRATSVT